MATGTRRPGDFCWINMLTPRPAEAREFFGTVLRWTYFEMPGLGHGMRVGGRDIGGLFDLEGPITPPGLSPTIGVMVKVEDADASCARIAALGGTAKPAFDVGPQGRMAVCFDPDGAEFDLWEPRAMPGTDVDSTLHGAPSWFESSTKDVDRASAFYSGLFGWTSRAVVTPGSAYTTFTNGDVDVAGLTPITPRMPGLSLTPGWATYFTVDDADEAADEATKLGATLHLTPRDVPGVGRSCGITSPQGVGFRVIQYTR